MYQGNAIDALMEVAKFGKEIAPVLADPTKLDDFIVGLADAREVLANRAVVDQKYADAEAMEKTNLDAAADLKIREDELTGKLNDYSNAMDIYRAAQAQLGIDQQKALDDAAANATDKSNNDARQKVIDDRESTIKDDLDAAADAKQKALDRLAALNNVPDGA